jgi:putative SOS response-associated peptidase YedK
MKMSRAEIFQLELDFIYKWVDEEPAELYASSGFSHPKLPVLTAEREFKYYRWGLIPSWVKDWESASKLRVQTLNAIGDTIDSKPSFRGAVKGGRFCIIPVKGFFEWHHQSEKEKFPHFIYPNESPFFYLGGLYEQWENMAINEVHNTFTIVTTPANSRMEWIHNSKKRMPFIMNQKDAKLWLDREIPFSEKKKMIMPFDEKLMSDHPISKLITSRKENPNTPKVLERFDYPELQAQ